MLDEKNETVQLQTGRKDFQTFAKSNLPRKIQALLDMRDFQPKLSWIAKKLDATLEEVQHALDLLEALDLIGWLNGMIVKKTNHTYVTDHLRSRSKSTLVGDHRLISHQLLNDVDPDNRFFVQNGFKASDEETLKKYYEKIMEVEKWFHEASEESKKTILVGYSFTGANVVKSEDGEKK